MTRTRLTPGWKSCLAAAALATACGGPSARSDDPAAVQRSLQALRDRSAEPLAVGRDADDVAVQALYGRLPAVGASELSAREALQDGAALLGVDGDAELVLERTVESPLGTHYEFAQRVNGVAVDGARASVSFNRRGEVVALHSTLATRAGEAAGKAELDAALAIDLARAEVAPGLARYSAEKPEAELVVHPGVGGARLAWRVTLPTSDGPNWEALVDARDGRLLVGPRDTNRYVTGSGQIWKAANAVVATHNNALKDSNDSATSVPTSAYQTVAFPNLTGNGFLDGTWASSSKTKKRVSNSGNAFVYDRHNVGFSEAMGYFHIDLSAQYVHGLGFASVMNRQQQFSANGTTDDNSWYTPGTKVITYGTGGVDDAEDAEVVLHELGHAIQDNQVPGFGSSTQAGSMGEGFGDYWAASRGTTTSAGYQDTCIMEWDATSYSTTNPPCLRRLDTAKHYPADVEGEVHADGEIWSAALWQIRAAIGGTKADTLVLQHHFLIPASSSFNTAASALVTAAKNLGYTTAECTAVRGALTGRGFTVSATCP